MIQSPLGPVSYSLDSDGALTRLWFGSGGSSSAAVDFQLSAYFARELRAFDYPLAPVGTEFQLRVWQELLRIPYGELRSYLDIANALGNPAATRAVGAANGQNPIAIVIPCHRVVGSNGKLTGYAGGVNIKAWLLDFERPTLFTS